MKLGMRSEWSRMMTLMMRKRVEGLYGLSMNLNMEAKAASTG